MDDSLFNCDERFSCANLNECNVDGHVTLGTVCVCVCVSRHPWRENFTSDTFLLVFRRVDDPFPVFGTRRLPLSLPPPPSTYHPPTPCVSLARDTQMRPSILRSHCYSKCSLPIVTMAGHSWHCCRYCYYYRYCYRLRPTGEWRRGEPAASSSAALEANYTPSGPPPVLFPLFFSPSSR